MGNYEWEAKHMTSKKQETFTGMDFILLMIGYSKLPFNGSVWTMPAGALHTAIYELKSKYKDRYPDFLLAYHSIKINIQKELIEFSKRYFAIEYYNDIIEKYENK